MFKQVKRKDKKSETKCMKHQDYQVYVNPKKSENYLTTDINAFDEKWRPC